MKPLFKRPRRKENACLILLALAASIVMVPVSLSANSAKSSNSVLCDTATRAEEKQRRIPSRLLYAIASVESGRWDKETRANIAWPWTVTARGKGKFYPTRQDAIRAVERLLDDGISNIDVGCMQINLRYHPKAFDTLYEAFEPAKNVAYAATFLNTLRKTRRSWSRAVRYYHSSDEKRQLYYGKKVYAAWKNIRQRDRQVQHAERREHIENRRKLRGGTTQTSAGTATGETTRIAASTVWSNRSYRQQRKAEMNARAWALTPK